MQWIIINIMFVMIWIGFPLFEFWNKVIAVGLNIFFLDYLRQIYCNATELTLHIGKNFHGQA